MFDVISFSGDLANLKAIMNKEIPRNDFKKFVPILVNLTKVTFSNRNVQNLINDDSQKFDLVIIEWMFTEAYAGYVPNS